MAGDMSAEALRSHTAAWRTVYYTFVSGVFGAERPRCRTASIEVEGALPRCLTHMLDVGA
jgi:hypothetical protein